eukprot:gene25356-37342_t
MPRPGGRAPRPRVNVLCGVRWWVTAGRYQQSGVPQGRRDWQFLVWGRGCVGALGHGALCRRRFVLQCLLRPEAQQPMAEELVKQDGRWTSERSSHRYLQPKSQDVQKMLERWKHIEAGIRWVGVDMIIDAHTDSPAAGYCYYSKSQGAGPHA